MPGLFTKERKQCRIELLYSFDEQMTVGLRLKRSMVLVISFK